MDTTMLDAMLASIPEPRMPTDDEKRPMVLETVSMGHHLSLQHLPAAVLALSFPVDAVTVTPGQAALLFQAMEQHHGGDHDRRDALLDETGLIPPIDAAIGRLGGEPAFVKLGTRSAKDGYDTDDDRRPNPVKSGHGALCHLLDSWERVLHDLLDARIAGIDTAVIVRPFVRFPVDREYRAYVIDGRIAGISQMFADRAHPDPRRATEDDQPRLRALATQLIAAMAAHGKRVTHDGTTARVVEAGEPCLDFTLDLVALEDGRTLAIEVNPPVTCGRVDPLLFRDRMGPDAPPMDGSFRIVTAADADRR